MKVKDLLRFGGLRNAEVAAGKAGLEHTVESVSVLEVAEAKISTWVTRNQLYITSFYAIKDTVGMQKVVIETLAKCGCCGLVICHKSLILGTVHPEVIALCDALDFPLLIARSEVSYVEILNPIIAKLEMNGASGGGYAKIKSEFLDLILREDDMGMVLKRISYELGYEISFLISGGGAFIPTKAIWKRSGKSAICRSTAASIKASGAAFGGTARRKSCFTPFRKAAAFLAI